MLDSSSIHGIEEFKTSTVTSAGGQSLVEGRQGCTGEVGFARTMSSARTRSFSGMP